MFKYRNREYNRFVRQRSLRQGLHNDPKSLCQSDDLIELEEYVRDVIHTVHSTRQAFGIHLSPPNSTEEIYLSSNSGSSKTNASQGLHSDATSVMVHVSPSQAAASPQQQPTSRNSRTFVSTQSQNDLNSSQQHTNMQVHDEAKDLVSIDASLTCDNSGEVDGEPRNKADNEWTHEEMFVIHDDGKIVSEVFRRPRKPKDV